MKSHLSTIVPRLIRTALKVHLCRYRIAAAGIDYRGRLISISTNAPRLTSRGWHAEERLIHTSPKSLARIILVRVNRLGELLPIDPCAHCAKLARRRGITIDPMKGDR